MGQQQQNVDPEHKLRGYKASVSSRFCLIGQG